MDVWYIHVHEPRPRNKPTANDRSFSASAVLSAIGKDRKQYVDSL